jgi:hypothetical protein
MMTTSVQQMCRSGVVFQCTAMQAGTDSKSGALCAFTHQPSLFDVCPVCIDHLSRLRVPRATADADAATAAAAHAHAAAPLAGLESAAADGRRSRHPDRPATRQHDLVLRIGVGFVRWWAVEWLH